MKARIRLALHSMVALLLIPAGIGVAVVIALLLAAQLGLKGKAYDNWMLGAACIGMVAGVVAMFAYRHFAVPARVVDDANPMRSPEVSEHFRRVEAAQQALREQLLASPGLERYAPLIGHSMIGSVEDARVLDVRVRELEGDPQRAKYAERVIKGEAITDRMMEYWEDPSARVLCSHFGSVEADIRKVDPRARVTDEHTLDAWLGFDFDALKQKYRIGPPVTFWRREWGPQYHGRGEDNYDGLEKIACPEHGCTLVGSEHWPKFPAA